MSLAAYKTSLIEQTALGSVSKETPNFRIRSDELALHIIKYAKVKFCFLQRRTLDESLCVKLGTLLLTSHQ